MATKILLLILFAITVVTKAAPLPAEWTAASKSINDMNKKMKKAFDEVNGVAPPEKKEKALDATLMQALTVGVILEKAKNTGDEKKVVRIARSYEEAADMVIAVPPSEKFKAMEETFNAVAAPDATQCPTVDKSFCETKSKIDKALGEVMSAAPKEEKIKIVDAVVKQGHRTIAAINTAYAVGDEKKIAEILAANNKAADMVIASAPAEKFKVMEVSFTVADATNPGA